MSKRLQMFPVPENSGDLPPVDLDAAHSPQKVLAHENLLRDFVAGRRIRPIHLRIGVTGACNMRCDFCNFHSERENEFYDRFSFKDALETDKCMSLLSQFRAEGGRAVTFCGSGESTIHPGYIEICRAAKREGLRVGLITNGLMLHHEDMQRCVVETHSWVRVGMNAGTPETFQKITKAKASTFLRMLNAAGQIRKAAPDPDFRLGLNYVITADNYEEIARAAILARDAGVAYIRFEPEFYSALGHQTIEERMAAIAAGLLEARQYATSSFEVSTPKLDRGPMDRTEKVEGDFHRCHYSKFVTAIGADGNLYPCPQVHLNSRYVLGNVVEKGYKDVLDGEELHSWERANPLRTELCRSCFYRPQNELLEWLQNGRIDLETALSEYAVEIPKTLHADFV